MSVLNCLDCGEELIAKGYDSSVLVDGDGNIMMSAKLNCPACSLEHVIAAGNGSLSSCVRSTPRKVKDKTDVPTTEESTD